MESNYDLKRFKIMNFQLQKPDRDGNITNSMEKPLNNSSTAII